MMVQQGWVFRRETGAAMSYGGLNRGKSSDAMWVSTHTIVFQNEARVKQ